VTPTYIFPNSKQDFDLLKSLGAERTLKKIHLQKIFGKVRMTTGVELEYKNGHKILLGERGTTNSSSFDKKVCSIEIKPTVSDAHGKERKICFYDDAGK
jgi:hypothetical protein